MKFIDPLATLMYVGGAPPIHLSMAIYAIFIYKYPLKNFCQEIPEVKTNTRDVAFIIFAHCLSVVVFTLKKFMSTIRCNGEYVRQFLIYFSITMYMGAFLMVYYFWAV